jgi:two-component sensor histidine kinase
LPIFIDELYKKLAETALGHSVICDADPMMISADHAIPLANELVTNAIKIPRRPRPDPGIIRPRDWGRLQVEISDQGIGLPSASDP